MKALRTVVLAAIAVALAAGPAAAAVPRAEAPNGVTARSIKLAYPDIDYAQLKDVGVNIDRGDTQQIFDALTRKLNKDGGVKGRDVEVKVVKYNLLNPADAESACVKMTEDLKVFGSLNAFDGPVQSVTKCITDHNTVLVGGSPVTSVARKTPWISQPASQERQAKVFVAIMAKKGLFKGKRIGISTDPAQERITKEIVVPELKKRGYRPKVVVVDDGPPGDTAAADANWDVFAEKFKSAKVNHVILLGNEATGGFTRLLDRDVKATVSSPTSGQLSSLGTAQTQRPTSDYNGAYSITGDTPDEIFADPKMQKCVKTFTKAHPSIKVKKPSAVAEGETDWATGILIACGQLDLFRTVAERAGKKLNNQSFIKAAQGMTANFVVAGNRYNTFGPKKYDSNNGFRLGVFDADFGATGGIKPIGPMQNIP
jgi:hypothetical protein